MFASQDKVTSKVDTKEAGVSISLDDFWHKVEAKLNELKKKKDRPKAGVLCGRQEEADRERAEHETRLKQVRTSWAQVMKSFMSGRVLGRIKKEDLDLMCSELPLCDRDVLERATWLRRATCHLPIHHMG